MLDSQLFPIIFGILNAGFAELGITINTKQSNQPTQQGANTDPTCYLYKIGPDEIVGFPLDESYWNANEGAEFTATLAGYILTVTVLASGEIAVGQVISGPGIPVNTLVTALGTGTGGIGTYEINQPTIIDDPTEMATNPIGMTQTITNQYVSTFQLNAWVTQDPRNTRQLTASDIANYARYILANPNTVSTLEDQGIGILKISQVLNVPFKTDADEFEYNPSFSFSLTHKQVIITPAPFVTSTELQVLPV